MSNINNLASSIFSQDRLIEVSNTLTVRVKHNYGRTLCYPVDDNAYAFLAIQGGKTLSDRTLDRAEQLGFAIQTETPNWRGE